jgi:hypothetical protein
VSVTYGLTGFPIELPPFRASYRNQRNNLTVRYLNDWSDVCLWIRRQRGEAIVRATVDMPTLCLRKDHVVASCTRVGRRWLRLFLLEEQSSDASLVWAPRKVV